VLEAVLTGGFFAEIGDGHGQVLRDEEKIALTIGAGGNLYDGKWEERIEGGGVTIAWARNLCANRAGALSKLKIRVFPSRKRKRR
jgi:hypothetical protein